MNWDLRWQDRAVCRDHPSPDELWYSELKEGQEVARAMCAPCPVLEACREFARATQQQYGVWGGETALQRKLAVGQVMHGTITCYQAGCRCVRCKSADSAYDKSRSAVSA
jgi:WhiB family transcriptional regulator, redox-sensing transcriptional regulator